MLGMSPYTDWLKGVTNRNFQVLNSLQKFDEVEQILYIDFLPFTWKRTLSHYLFNIFSGIKNRETLFGDLTSRCTKVSSKISVYSTIDSKFSDKKVVEEIKTVIKRLGFSDFVFWSYNPMFIDLFKSLNASVNIFDTVDNWLTHPSYKNYYDRLKNNYKTISNEADIIYTVADKLKDFYAELGRNNDVHYIENGVDLDRFEKDAYDIPVDMTKIKKPIIGYVGTIQNRLDLDILENAYSKNPDKSFVMIGPTWPMFLKSLRQKSKEAQLMAKYKNVHYLGRKSFRETPAYLSCCDVMIIPHREDDFLKYTSPTKLYEFLAAGKPVVSTRGAGVDLFANLVHTASDSQEFNEKIELALKETANQELATRRKQAAQEHSWDKRVQKMLDILQSKML